MIGPPGAGLHRIAADLVVRRSEPVELVDWQWRAEWALEGLFASLLDKWAAFWDACGPEPRP